MILNPQPSINAGIKAGIDLKEMANQTQVPGSITKILMLEDNANDAELISMYLKNSSLTVVITLVSNEEDYIKILTVQEFDVILSDHNMPQFSSLEALKIRNRVKFHIPFILVSGAVEEEYTVAILHEGANDYILKDRLQRLPTSIIEAIKKQKALAAKKLAEEELSKTNERYRLVCKATADAIWEFDIKEDKLFWGEGYEKLFGHKIKEFAAGIKSRTDYIHPDDVDRIVTGLQEVINNKIKIYWTGEYRFMKADGTYAFVLDKGIVSRDENGNAYRIVGAMQDLTQMKNLELEITRQKINYQKENTEIAIQSQDEERNNIGRELHDNISQLLANAKMMLDTAHNSPELHDICINKSYEAITLAIEETRKLSHSLVPPSFNENDSFNDAVNELVANINLSGKISVIVNIISTGKFTQANEKIKLTFYRIIQEQLHNILKYAKASNASIDVQELSNVFQLTVSDDGVGFNTQKKATGIGLRNIASRVELHSGNMKIISSPGQGCKLVIEIPIEQIFLDD